MSDTYTKVCSRCKVETDCICDEDGKPVCLECELQSEK